MAQSSQLMCFLGGSGGATKEVTSPFRAPVEHVHDVNMLYVTMLQQMIFV